LRHFDGRQFVSRHHNVEPDGSKDTVQNEPTRRSTPFIIIAFQQYIHTSLENL
jgi:hypothetical protein